MARFFLAWIIFTALSGGYFYLANKSEKKEIRKIAWKLGVSSLVGLLIIVLLMGANNLQGL